MNFNAETDLTFERIVPIAPEKLFAGWTVPELINQWFTPAPFRTVHAHVDLRPGGVCGCTMISPEGEEYPQLGCVLEVIPDRRYVFTSALAGDFRPQETMMPFTGWLEFQPVAEGTRYVVYALHRTAEEKQNHEQMGFYEGWNKALDQLIELMSAR